MSTYIVFDDNSIAEIDLAIKSIECMAADLVTISQIECDNQLTIPVHYMSAHVRRIRLVNDAVSCLLNAKKLLDYVKTENIDIHHWPELIHVKIGRGSCYE